MVLSGRRGEWILKRPATGGIITDKNILVKAIINGVITWLLLPLVMCLIKDANFVDSLISPTTICIAIAAGIGSYIGYVRKTRK